MGRVARPSLELTLLHLARNAIAIIINLFRNTRSIDAEQANQLKN
jgi:NADH:ubiquinone oxidoreductase subunit K